MKENAESTTKQGNEANTMLCLVDDVVEVIANVDNFGLKGKVVSISEKLPHNIKVDFIDTWCCYSIDEVRKVN
jgi:hypothetical protein